MSAEESLFGDNYSDLSDETGFQFDFTCEGCNDAWRSPLKKYLAGEASQWLNTAGSLLGGLMGNVGSAAESVRDAGYKQAREKAFREAAAEAVKHFSCCSRCRNYFCGKCWNKTKRLCINCAPDVSREAAAAENEVEIEKERTAIQEGKKPKSAAKPKAFCADCGEKLPAVSKFCPACGKKA